MYQAESDHAFLSDVRGLTPIEPWFFIELAQQTYKRTPIHFYDPRKAPLLDHYRLKVPAVRSVLEYCE